MLILFYEILLEQNVIKLTNNYADVPVYEVFQKWKKKRYRCKIHEVTLKTLLCQRDSGAKLKKFPLAKYRSL